MDPVYKEYTVIDRLVHFPYLINVCVSFIQHHQHIGKNHTTMPHSQALKNAGSVEAGMPSIRMYSSL